MLHMRCNRLVVVSVGLAMGALFFGVTRAHSAAEQQSQAQAARDTAAAKLNDAKTPVVSPVSLTFAAPNAESSATLTKQPRESHPQASSIDEMLFPFHHDRIDQAEEALMTVNAKTTALLGDLKNAVEKRASLKSQRDLSRNELAKKGQTLRELIVRVSEANAKVAQLTDRLREKIGADQGRAVKETAEAEKLAKVALGTASTTEPVPQSPDLEKQIETLKGEAATTSKELNTLTGMLRNENKAFGEVQFKLAEQCLLVQELSEQLELQTFTSEKLQLQLDRLRNIYTRTNSVYPDQSAPAEPAGANPELAKPEVAKPEPKKPVATKPLAKK